MKIYIIYLLLILAIPLRAQTLPKGPGVYGESDTTLLSFERDENDNPHLTRYYFLHQDYWKAYTAVQMDFGFFDDYSPLDKKKFLEDLKVLIRAEEVDISFLKAFSLDSVDHSRHR